LDVFANLSSLEWRVGYAFSTRAYVALLFSGSVAAEDVATYTDKEGSIYKILSQRPFADDLRAVMIEVEHDNSIILMEMALDCRQEQYAYLGMLFDLPLDRENREEAERVMGYSDSILTSKIGGLRLTELDVNLENESVIALFDMGCGRG